MGHSHDSARTLMRAGVFVLIVVGLVGCAGAPVKPFSDAADTRNLTHDQLVVWHQSNEQDEALANVGAVYDDPALQAYLQGVINRLYPQFEGAIRVHVLKSPVPNAFMMANGSCYVQLGLLALFDNEAQLAAVLGHEGGHFVRQHGLQMHEYAQNTAALAMVLGMVVPIVGPAMAVSSIYGYSREMEAEADSIGFERLKAAGYDVRQAIVPFELLDQYSQALNIKEPYFFADHPKLETRIQYYRAQAAITGQTSGYAGEKAYLTASSRGVCGSCSTTSAVRTISQVSHPLRGEVNVENNNN